MDSASDRTWAKLTAMTAVLWLGGCASDSAPDENVRLRQEPFGVSSCSTATADIMRFTSSIGGGGGPSGPSGGSAGGPSGPSGGSAGAGAQWLSTSGYDTCFRGYVVDFPNLNAVYAGTKTTPSGRDGRIFTEWSNEAPQSQEACEHAWTSAIVYKKMNGQWVDQTGVVNTYGVWSGSPAKCGGPVYFSDIDSQLVLEAGASYRLAATVRPFYASATRLQFRYGLRAPN